MNWLRYILVSFFLAVASIWGAEIEYPVKVLTPPGESVGATWWRIDPPGDGFRRTDMRVVSTMLDTLWWEFHTLPIKDGPVEGRSFRQGIGGLPETAGTVDEFLVPLPVEIAGPSWQSLASGEGAYQGVTTDPYQFRLRFGVAARSGPVMVKLSEFFDGQPVANSTSNAAILVVGADGSLLEALWEHPPIVSDNGKLVAQVRRIGVAVAPGVPQHQVWEAATLEWMRLPDQPGNPTVWWSPVRAGVVTPLQGGPSQLQTTNLDIAPRDLMVSKYLADPRSGIVEPGVYIVRLTVAWLRAEDGTVLVARSRPHRVEVGQQESQDGRK